jgi:hypothetical protein
MTAHQADGSPDTCSVQTPHVWRNVGWRVGRPSETRLLCPGCVSRLVPANWDTDRGAQTCRETVRGTSVIATSQEVVPRGCEYRSLSHLGRSCPTPASSYSKLPGTPSWLKSVCPFAPEGMINAGSFRGVKQGTEARWGMSSGPGIEWGPCVKTREVLTTNEPHVPPDRHARTIEAFNL